MNLLYNQNWENARKKFTGWWNGENTTKPLLQVLAPRNVPVEDVPAPPPPATVEDQWLDIDRRIDQYHHHGSRTFYGGDAVPYFETSLGPGTMALYIDSPPTFHSNTVWYGPIYDDITTAPLPEYNPDNKYWKWSQKIAKDAVERFKGKALVAYPDLIEHVDILASLVGTQELLFHMIDQPRHVHRLLERLTELYFVYYDQLYDIIKDEQGGSCFCAFSVWGPGKTAKLQCDYSAMISPDMFREYVSPYLREQCRRLDYSVYHWDGPCCIQHLDPLLEIEELQAIQWTPGAGQPGVGNKCWWHLYRPILDKGKSLMLMGVAPDQIQPLLDEFGPERLDMMVWCGSEDQAREVVENYG